MNRGVRPSRAGSLAGQAESAESFLPRINANEDGFKKKIKDEK